MPPAGHDGDDRAPATATIAGKKRTYRNQYLGPFIHHEMNRCITCYRCTRYYRDYAGGGDLAAFGSRDRVLRPPGGGLESPSSPATWWRSAPPACSPTSPWCETTPASGTCSPRRRFAPAAAWAATPCRRALRRTQACPQPLQPEVNGYFLCDRGRFGMAFRERHRSASSGRRVVTDLFDVGDQPTRPSTAWLGHSCATAAPGGIGSPRASLEANALQPWLARELRQRHGRREQDMAQRRSSTSTRSRRCPTTRR